MELLARSCALATRTATATWGGVSGRVAGCASVRNPTTRVQNISGLPPPSVYPTKTVHFAGSATYSLRPTAHRWQWNVAVPAAGSGCRTLCYGAQGSAINTIGLGAGHSTSALGGLTPSQTWLCGTTGQAGPRTSVTYRSLSTLPVGLPRSTPGVVMCGPSTIGGVGMLQRRHVTAKNRRKMQKTSELLVFFYRTFQCICQHIFKLSLSN